VPAGSEDEGEDDFGMKLLRALRMVRLLRMLKLLNIQRYIDALEDAYGVNMQILKIFKMVAGLLYLMHLLGCFWYFVGTNGEHEQTWLTNYDDGSAVGAPTAVGYLYSIYWALTTLTTVGYGDITPANNSERYYALASLLIGALVFGYMLSSIGELLGNIDKNAVNLDAKLAEVKDFTRWHKMTPELAARVRKYYEYYYARKSAMDEESILSHLAPSLRREVVHHLLERTAARIPMFSLEYCSYASVELQLEVHPLLKPLVYEAGEVLVAKGSLGDDLFFLNKGTVYACSALDQTVLFPISATGAFFGEHVLCNTRAELTYRAATRCEFFCLAKLELYDLLEQRPHAREELADFVFEDLLRHAMLRFWALRMLVKDVRTLEPRTGAALQLQVAWMKRQIYQLQESRAKHAGSLEWLMPGLFGQPEPLLSKDVLASPRATPRGAEASNGNGVTLLGPVRKGGGMPAHTTTVATADALEVERLQFHRREAAMEQQIAAMQKMVAQLSASAAARRNRGLSDGVTAKERKDYSA